MALAPMAPGGQWLQVGANPPLYVTHEAHVRRLVVEHGAQVIADPRVEQQQEKPKPQSPSAEDTLRQEVESLKAQLAQLLSKFGQADGAAPALEGELIAANISVEKHARRSGKE